MEKLKAIERIQDSLNKLPSVGKKSAERMAFSILDLSDEDINELSESIKQLKSRIHICPICGALTENSICDICANPNRDRQTIMVVSYPKDVLSFEKSDGYKGLYHVLGGVISIGKGVGINDLKIPQLIERIEKENIKEVILATNPTLEGETTALYISRLLADKNVITSRIAYGLPMGASLDYTDSLTLYRALEGRRKL